MRGKAFPDFDIQLERGQIVEEAFREAICGPLEVIRFEVKSERDSRTHVFIEYEAYGKPSGIVITKAERYAIEVSPDVFIVLPTDKLAALAREYLALLGPRKGGEGGLATGVVIPKRVFVEL